jgi:hypothetical protein
VSLRATRWAWRARAGNAKVVLLALADLADDSGYCFPSHDHLMKMCEISERTVRRMITLLVAAKLITIERRFNGNGSCTSNGYQLAIRDYPVNLTGRVVKLDRGRGSAVTPPLVTGDQVTTTELVLYPKTTTSTTPTALPKPMVGDDGSSDSELCFPKTVTASERRTLANQVQALSHDQAQQVLDELAGRMASKRVHSPVKYCAALIRSVRRGEFRPVVGCEIADRRNAGQQQEARLRASPPRLNQTASVSTVHLPEVLRAPLERARAKAMRAWADKSADSDSSAD